MSKAIVSRDPSQTSVKPSTCIGVSGQASMDFGPTSTNPGTWTGVLGSASRDLGPLDGPNPSTSNLDEGAEYSGMIDGDPGLAFVNTSTHNKNFGLAAK